MAKFVTTKFGTKINVEGLSDAQAKKVLSVAQDKGAYGKKGAALAKQLQKKAGGGGNMPGTGGSQNVDLGVGNKGQIDTDQATDTVLDANQQDWEKNINVNNPGSQTDIFGNTQNVEVDPVTGKTSITQNAGQTSTATQNAFMNALNDFNSGGSAAQAAQDANYNYITKDYSNQKMQEMEAAKTELQNRGIPMDTRPDSLWNKTLSNIDNKYQGLFDQAKNQAITTGNQTLATRTNALGTLGSTMQNQSPTFTQFQGGTSDQSGLMAQLLQILSGANLNREALRRKGGGGTTTTVDTSPAIGGAAPGFEV